MRHVLACAGHFWCNEATHSANAWVIPLTLATFAGFVLLIWLVTWLRND
jgi:hypothetical protein